MIARARRPMPTWFVLLVALAYWLIFRHELAATPADPRGVQYAWFAWIIIVAQAIWTGVEIAGHVTLVALHWAVVAIWTWLQLIMNAARELGIGVLRGFKASWSFLQATYENILRPGWEKFWHWIDRARHWLEEFFAPAFKVLRRIRDEILKFYEHWVTPVLDAIGIARKVLTVLTTFGIEWAKALDAKLAWLEDKINEPFLFALRQINSIIGVLDRIVTANGLFQRLALIRSIERDIMYVHAQLFNGRSNPLAAADLSGLANGNTPRKPAEIFSQLDRALLTNELAFWTEEEFAAFARPALDG
jgi:hypothetical protein